jgi:hypothetical protein
VDDVLAITLFVARVLDRFGVRHLVAGSLASSIMVQGEALDLEYLREAAPLWNVADLLERALASGDRPG